MEATPLAQVALLAGARPRTGEPTVAPLTGLLTVTPANAEVAKAATRQKYTYNFITAVVSFCWICFREVGA